MSEEHDPVVTESILKSTLTSALTSALNDLERRIDTRLEERITEEGKTTRRHFDVVAEGLRGDLKVVIEKTNATSVKVDRLITRNAIEHAAFVDAIADHEVRQRVLERIFEPPANDNS
jgi:predicted helicase